MGTQQFTADRSAYLRTNAWLAALAMTSAMALLWVMGNAHVWTGAVAGLAAIIVRGWYLASEELTAVWEMDGERITGPGGRQVSLDQISKVRKMGSFVQVITRNGDKHLIKYQADPDATVAAIERAAA
ncbi:hypothetical protein [Antarcticimicrobium sediminis]|uniref:PH domain-containing protein n=1 Tax=Antarcticimicrobium sediminis TaxID=2546227 RepID=A0A4R5EXR0_9RHOB|nr:hypothetical protein [Antarcticimicrobium sediminis]TDE39784.1 hypothetical protein E1B25_06970 [Antarcticimicrobium sediminis]